eukprot:m.61629 g.61629  ORF g.61629 m.61629 type:complete len:115 (+) comp49481_c0_seq2:553-897(+)
MPNFWLYDYSVHPWQEGKDCCAPDWITAHYSTPEMLLRFHANLAKGRDADFVDPTPAPPTQAQTSNSPFAKLKQRAAVQRRLREYQEFKRRAQEAGETDEGSIVAMFLESASPS